MKTARRLLGIIISTALLFSCIPNNVIHAEEEERDTILRLTDSISYSARDFTSLQEGELYFKKYNSSTDISATNDIITVKHTRQANWQSNFYIDGSKLKTDKKTVINIRFKAELDDYSVSNKPNAAIRLYTYSLFESETELFVPQQDDGMHTLRIVLDPDTEKVYTSMDGSTYSTSPLWVPQSETYSGEIRIYPVALVPKSGATDGVTELSTPVTFSFDEFYIYQTSGDMPSETEDINVYITQEQSEEFDMLRERWKYYLIGDENNVSDEQIKDKINGTNSSAQYHWSRMNKDADRTYLFSDVTNLDESSHIRSNYNYLFIMAKAYATPGGALYKRAELKDDIISALDWMYDNEYNENTQRYDNWWEWEIGVPQVLNNIIVLLYDDLTADRIEKYERAVNHFSPDPRYCCLPDRIDATAANRLSMCFVVGLRGIIVKDPARVKLASESLDIVFDYVTSGDGFYIDGSFIQHDKHPYNGGYGLGMVSDLAIMMYLLGGSSYEVNVEGRDNVYDWIYKGYVPLMYNGIMTDAVTGRDGSRSYHSTYCAATILKAVLLLAEEADDKNKEKLKSLAKKWISENTLGNLYTDSNIEISTIKMMNELMADDSVISAETEEGNYQYSGMDRVVHNRDNYSFVVSMYSDRIYNYESILGENLKGWHTADGMTYLYNSDTAQYTDAFWPTVDAKRLPGTTVSDNDLSPSEGANSVSSENQVGGASLDGMYGSVCMSLKGNDSKLCAKKSWFMFDNEIVALGSDITNTDNSNIETIIDNRKLNLFGNNEFVADGSIAVTNMGTEQTLTDVKWMHLNGNTEGSDIGYYMFDGADVKALRETRTGTWRDVNLSNTDTPVSKSYMTLWVDHGKQPVDDTYAYALLPGKSMEETKQFADNPTVEIIRNDSSVQAVKNTELGIIGANFWTDSEEAADKITCNTKASVMVREDNGELTFGISDPTQSNNGTIEITYDGAAGEIISCDDRVTVLSTYPKVKLSVAVSGSHGQTQNVKFKKTVNEYINPYVLIDENISVSGDWTYTINGNGNIQFRAWTTPASKVESDKDTFSVIQTTKSMYKDHFLISSSKAIPYDSPTLIKIRYKVNAAEENTTEEASLSLYLPGITSWKAGTGTIKLDKYSDEYHTLIMLISPSDRKIYYSNDNGNTFSETDFEGEMTQDITEARLYTVAKPDSSYSTDGDGETNLQSPVTWTFDSIEISPYIDDGRHILFYSFNSGKADEGIEYTAEAVNVSASVQSASIVAAAYDDEGRLIGVDIKDVNNIPYNEKATVSGIINTNKTDNLTVKAFLWDSINGMMPYDKME